MTFGFECVTADVCAITAEVPQGQIPCELVLVSLAVVYCQEL
jgi:hypothetical protein